MSIRHESSAEGKGKIDKYRDLKIEIIRMWKCKEVLIVAIVIGVLGTVHNNFHM